MPEVASLRRCTKQRLCPQCRVSPEFRIVTRSQILKDTELSPEEIDDNLFSVGTIKNSYHPAFARSRVYLWKDVFRLLLDFDRPIPDNW